MLIARGIRGDAVAAVPALALSFQNDSGESIREYVADALGYIGPPAKAALPVLGALPAGEHPYVSLSATKAIWQITGDSEPVVAKAMELLRDRSVYVQKRAADVLAEVGPAAAKAIPALRELYAKTGESAYADALRRIAPAK